MLTPYVTWTSYWPHGGIEKQRYGNALVRTRMFNSRLQLWQDWDAINDSPNYFLSYESYAWGSSNNDGNLQARGALSGGPGNWYSLTQQYSQFYDYDSLNRITSSSDYSSGMCNGTCWSRNFQYDQWGNMWVTANGGVLLAGNTPTSNIYNPANNQMYGQQYDAAANLTLLNGNTALYDADNHLISVSEPPAFGGSRRIQVRRRCIRRGFASRPWGWSRCLSKHQAHCWL